MARLKLPPLNRKIFETKMDVRVEHINYGGHMGNDKFLSFAHEARVRFLSSVGATELDFFHHGLIMLDSCVSYRAEIFQGDQLVINLDIDDIQETSFDFLYSFQKSDKTAALLKTSMCFFDYTTKKIQPVPEAFKQRYGR